MAYVYAKLSALCSYILFDFSCFRAVGLGLRGVRGFGLLSIIC